MKCADYAGLSIEVDRGRVAKLENEFWPGLAFIKVGPWPEFACVPDYDSGEPETRDGKSVIEFEMENGKALYEVLEPCEYGCAYHLKLITGTKD